VNELTVLADKLSEKHSFTIAYKDESGMMKFLGVVLKLICPQFMTRYITTIGRKVYFPSSEFVAIHAPALRSVLSHEFYHIWDAERTSSLLWHVLWLMPQALAPLALLALLAFVWPPAIWMLLCLVFLLPWPAYWRKKYELGGYTMSLFVLNELLKDWGLDEKERREELIKTADTMDSNQFRGAYYYFMWPFGVKKELHQSVDAILNGDILDTEEVFPFVLKCLNESKPVS
jgi:hypothetical protein